MLALNSILCLYITQINENELPHEAVDKFFILYFSSPETMTSEYDALQAYENEQNALWSEQMKLGNYDFKPNSLRNKYAPEGYSDAELFNEIFNRIHTIQAYPSDIQNVINRANANLREFDSSEISPDAYTYKYQLRVIDIYKNTQTNVKMGLEYTRGWDDYFTYDILNIFIFASLIMIGTVVFAQEKSSGFLPIIRVSKYGRTKTALAKIMAMMFITTVIVLLFTAETWLIFGLRLGYSSPYNAIQVFDEFVFCPYVITVGQYFIITVAVKLLTFMLFSGIIMTISVFVYNYAVIYIFGLGFFGLNFLFYTLRYINAENLLKNLNLVATAAVNPLFVRYRSINLFGNILSELLRKHIFVMTVTVLLTLFPAVFAYFGMNICKFYNNKYRTDSIFK